MASASSPLPPTLATMPRTSEVLWDGRASLPFVLKRKRTGAILITKIKERRAPNKTLDVRLGSELKLVGGFPVQQLTLSEVKKVMLHAPKPVSLVFVNHDDVVLDNMSFLSEDRGSFENEFAYDSAYHDDDMPPLRESSEYAPSWFDTDPLPGRPLHSVDSTTSEFHPFASSRSSSTLESFTMSSSSTLYDTSSSSRRRRRSPTEAPKPRKVSRLKLALERMNELLNRPVRRSGLNVAAGKSIVV